MARLIDIEEFMVSEKIAVAGVSRNPKKFSRVMYNHLKKNDISLVAINPNVDEIDGEKCYKSVGDLPSDYKRLLITTPKSQTESVVKEAINKGMEMVWIQQGSSTKEAFELVKKSNMKVINNECVLMFAKPVKGIHGIHKFLRTMFGGMPK